MLSKKLKFAILIIAICASLTACGSSTNEEASSNDNTVTTNIQVTTSNEENEFAQNTDTQEVTTEAETEAVQEDISETESNLNIVSHTLSKDYSGKDVLIVEYTWTNTDDKAISFMSKFKDKVFQNGIACDGVVIGCDEIDSQQVMNDVQPGITYNLKVGYLLQDMTNAQVLVTDLFGSTTYLDETIDLGGGEGSSASNGDELKETSFKIVSYSIGKDYKDEDILIIEYEYYNGDDKAKSFSLACNDKAFQNGIECDSLVMGCDDIDSQQQLNDVQPGNTYNVKVGYHLSDMSEVSIEITDLFENNTLLSEKIDPSNIN